MVGVQNPGFPAEPVCQSGRGCCHPSARHTRACSHVSCGQGVPRGVKEKTSPCSLPSLQTETLWAGPTLSLTHCGLGGKDTHAPLFLSGETSQLQARKQILNTYVYKYTHTHTHKTIHTHLLLSSRVNKTFLVYSGTFCTLQNHHKKPQPHLDTSPWSI